MLVLLRAILLTVFISSVGYTAQAETAPQTLTVEAYIGVKGQVHHYDADGRRLGTMAISDLPPVGGTVLDETGARVRYRLDTVKGPVWLAASSVRVKEKLTLATDCEKLDRLKAAQSPQRAAAGRGLADCKE